MPHPSDATSIPDSLNRKLACPDAPAVEVIECIGVPGDLRGAHASLTDEEKAQGFVALFNGRDLSGWVGNKAGFKIEDGIMVYDPASGNRGNLYTEKEYGDFQFRFEFQLTPGANNGVGIRAPLEGDAAYVGMEIQVLDDTAAVYAALQPYQYHGSVYGVIPARRGSLKPVGEWNSEEIVAAVAIGIGIEVAVAITIGHPHVPKPIPIAIATPIPIAMAAGRVHASLSAPQRMRNCVGQSAVSRQQLLQIRPEVSALHECVAVCSPGHSD